MARAQSSDSVDLPQEPIQTPQTNVFSNHELHNRHHFELTPEFDRESSVAVNSTTVPGAEPSELSAPRLLMAPPRTHGGEFRYQMSILGYRISSGLGTTAEAFSSTFRLAIFLLKFITLTRPCWPYVVSFQVGTPLVIIAAIELGWPISAGNEDWRGRGTRRQLNIGATMALLLVHFITLWIARRWNILCTPPSQDEWAQWRDDPKVIDEL